MKSERGRVWEAHFKGYGVRKVWRQWGGEPIEVARCTVARLRREVGVYGVVRGQRVKTPRADEALARPVDRVQRPFTASRPNARWVSALTDVATWQGFL